MLHIVCNLGKALKGTVVKSESCMELIYRVSQKTWEFSDELDIVFVMN